ncbi:acyl dehydratase [Motiliproteus coralliicola]|uniref:Acyl dehydratase n=1 Tax=Motiliproteus coralliicola TaxID=2283196 RepID=A0A369WW06_9GAMM|nr:MaoC family dehydratase [Motiliproteus coralliicola]RDE24726.1 acyl dehydratase [Motiliproteus coralliicola]
MTDLHGYYIEDLSEGMSASIERTVTEADVNTFAEVTGDDNPVHVNAEYAATTMFKQRIAHGMLSAGYISAVLGTKMPGPGAIYVDQQLKFKAPVMIGDTVTTTATILEINARRRRVILKTVCSVADKVVAEGQATLMVDSKG